jgi:hypothetical protein
MRSFNNYPISDIQQLFFTISGEGHIEGSDSSNNQLGVQDDDSVLSDDK